MSSTCLPLKPVLVSFLLTKANAGRQKVEFVFHVGCEPTGKVSSRRLYWQYLLNTYVAILHKAHVGTDAASILHTHVIQTCWHGVEIVTTLDRTVQFNILLDRL